VRAIKLLPETDQRISSLFLVPPQVVRIKEITIHFKRTEIIASPPPLRPCPNWQLLIDFALNTRQERGLSIEEAMATSMDQPVLMHHLNILMFIKVT